MDPSDPSLDESRPGAVREVTTGHLMMPDMANHLGNIHGGDIMKLIDQTAAMCACRYTRSDCVTASIDRVDFKSPIAVHSFVKMHARVEFTGRTSLEIGVMVFAEDMRTGKVTHTNACYVTMVSVDTDMKPCPVIPFVPADDEERERWEAARLRRDARLERMRAAGDS